MDSGDEGGVEEGADGRTAAAQAYASLLRPLNYSCAPPLPRIRPSPAERLHLAQSATLMAQASAAVAELADSSSDMDGSASADSGSDDSGEADRGSGAVRSQRSSSDTAWTQSVPNDGDASAVGGKGAGTSSHGLHMHGRRYGRRLALQRGRRRRTPASPAPSLEEERARPPRRCRSLEILHEAAHAQSPALSPTLPLWAPESSQPSEHLRPPHPAPPSNDGSMAVRAVRALRRGLVPRRRG